MDGERLIEIIEQAGYKPERYSGRGMYGHACISVIDDNPFRVVMVIVATVEDYDESMTIADLYTEQDDMGLSKVVYWPYISWPESEEVDGG